MMDHDSLITRMTYKLFLLSRANYIARGSRCAKRAQSCSQWQKEAKKDSRAGCSEECLPQWKNEGLSVILRNDSRSWNGVSGPGASGVVCVFQLLLSNVR